MRNAQQMVRTRCYCGGVLTDSDFSLDDVSEHLKDESAMVRVDLCGPDLQDLQLVPDELGLHSLAVENATSGRQRPKFNRSSGHEFLTVYAVHLDVKTGELVTGEIAAFVTRSALVTVRKDDQFPINGVLTRWDDNADLTKHGIGALAPRRQARARSGTACVRQDGACPTIGPCSALPSPPPFSGNGCIGSPLPSNPS